MSTIEDMLKGVDANVLESGMETARAFAQTPEGKKFVEQFKNKIPTDKEDVLRTIANNPDMMKALNQFLKN
ncbi:MAG: hypothetical protein PUB07_00135 [Clostridia bacterium]|nr:hypothetical protein [Clostridia bacterium]